MKRGTIFLVSLFLCTSIIGFTLEVSILASMSAVNGPAGCYKSTPSTGLQRVDCIDPNRPFLLLPPLLAATGAVAVAADRTANRRLALRFSGSVLVALGILFLILGVVGFQMDVPLCTIYGCPSVFSSYYATDWDKVYAGLAMTASGIALMFVSRAIPTDKKSVPVKTDSMP